MLYMQKGFSTDDDNENIIKSVSTWKYRGAAHNICNLRYKALKETSVVLIIVLRMTIIL